MLTPVRALLVAAVLAGGCSSDTTTGTGTAGSTPGSTTAVEGSITVAGAASLRDAFTELGEDFADANPDAEVTFSFDSSSTLATQIIEGAPVDVFASADQANMTKLTDPGLVAGQPQVFARNELVIVTKPGNPAGITGLADLASAGTISLCGADVPCGKYATEALGKANVTIPESAVTRGQNVTATLTAVTEGDAVAGIVYATDAASAGDAVTIVEIADEHNVIATYPIAVLAASTDADVAEAFMAFVLSPDGQTVLAQHGFLPPA